LAATEALSGKSATAPRVSIPDIESLIASEHYLNAGDAVALAEHHSDTTGPLNLMTICLLVLSNGFIEVGHSAPASPENYNPEKGRTFAKENAIRALWPKLGYALRDKLHARDVAEDVKEHNPGIVPPDKVPPPST
jgi:hypothetical protein